MGIQRPHRVPSPPPPPRRQRWLRRAWPALGALLGLCLCVGALLLYPPVGQRAARRLDSALAQLQRRLNPPEEVLFVPQQAAQATLQARPTLAVTPAAAGPTPEAQAAAAGAASPTAAALPVVETLPPTVTPLPPTATLPPLPPQAALSGIRHQYQLFNNCGPANLAMALSYWGWAGDQTDTRAFLRPNLEVDDKNVMTSEMVAFVAQQPGLRAMARVGGDAALLKRLLAAGFPVIIEAGHDPADDFWMGHYLVVSGYADERRRWTVQDSLIMPDLPVPYDELDPGPWRDFNYVYLLVYPEQRQAEVEALLGERLDEAQSYRIAEQRALDEITRLDGRDLFFAWFNLGSSRVGLGDYAGAAQAYDQAFALYSRLPEDLRPYRLMWYQVGPYEAYYNTGRYQDVVDLANTTFTWVGRGVLEESFYWRGLAYAALGMTNQAIKDLQKAAALNPNYAAPREALNRLGAPAP
ncbi:MAG: tetratricopeptide repeat protein [Chloroflexota bacterium]